MVIRREVGLEEYTEHSVALDAIVSHQILISIFLPTSPIHDGAVIIDKGRIVGAGAVLPLSFNPSLSSDLGTRHRAAIGFSERTDALVVVVSEETGTISLVREGRISRDLNEKTLYNALHRLAVFPYQRRRKGFFSQKTIAKKQSAASESAESSVQE
jgi:diadenylate cyclase